MEQIAIDQGNLLTNIMPEAKPMADQLRVGPLGERIRQGALVALTVFGEKAVKVLAEHPSDTARAWAAVAVGLAPDLSVADRFLKVRASALDHHFGVREWAWIGIRPYVIDETEESISLLRPWTKSDSERLRRFASESTRPRGVWSKHSLLLKREPERAESLLAELRNDDSRYVQKSVGNWLNDAAKTRPDWVKGLCKRWIDESPTSNTAWICCRGQRSLRDAEVLFRTSA